MSETGPAPVNDRIADAMPLTGATVMTTGTNRGATGEGSDPVIGLPDFRGPWPSVWWSWTLPRAGAYRISTRGNDFDARLTLAFEPTSGGLGLLGGNDDRTADDFTSQLR